MNRFDDADDPRRRVLVQALGLGLLGGTLPPGLAHAASAFGDRPSKLPPGQSIYRMSGNVRVNEQAASLQTRIKPGDTVQTGRDSELVFVVGNQALMMRSESQLKLEDGDSSTIINGLRLLTGKLLSVFGRGNPVRINTVTATIGIRGTGVYLEADPEQTYFCTCYGITEVESASDPSSRDTITATHHDRPVYILKDGAAGRKIRRAPFINHTDQELMLIETLVGRTPPFVFPGDQYSGPRREY
jgi:hypothetical protein